MDALDAALCALTAHHFALGNFKCYGDATSGFIVVPVARSRTTKSRVGPVQDFALGSAR
jgi:predicted RNase H-like nuclease